MLQNTSLTLGFMKIMVYKTPPGGGRGGGKPYLARGLLNMVIGAALVSKVWYGTCKVNSFHRFQYFLAFA